MRDYDLQIPAIVTTVPIHGLDTEIVLVAGKMDKVYALAAGPADPGLAGMERSHQPGGARSIGVSNYGVS